MRSDRPAAVISRWPRPPRATQGGAKVGGGARYVLLLLVIDAVKEVIKEEVDAVVEEVKEKWQTSPGGAYLAR